MSEPAFWMSQANKSIRDLLKRLLVKLVFGFRGFYGLSEMD
jgi:hypothetical protein